MVIIVGLNQFSRTELLIGKEGIEKLNNAKVAIFGLGGVGSFVLEGLVRAGVQNFILVDDDKICLTNLNRQIIATRKTIGKYKVDVAKERILEINPSASVEIYQEFFMPESNTKIIKEDLTYVIDCIDTVTAKIELVQNCKKIDIPIISAMGTGNKLHPEMLEITDVFKTSVCPLAKVMRKELKDRGVKKLKVCYSKEIPLKPLVSEEVTNKRSTPGSISFVPSTAGLLIAGEIIRDICSL